MQSLLCMTSLSIEIIPPAKLLTCTLSTLQSNRACLSLLSQNEQISHSNLGASMFSRTMWLSWARAYNITFQRNEGDEKSRILSSNIEIEFTFPFGWGNKGLVMTFDSTMLSNCINLLSIRSWIRYLNCTHSSKVCLSGPKWCQHFIDELK